MTDSSTFDDALVNRAAAPGSLRYFALLYTPEERRDSLTALFIIDTEIRDSAASASHDVAHTRLRWWRGEVDRLLNGSAQHPATKLLQERAIGPRSAFEKLHELLTAADMDLARMTYVNPRELRAYCTRSGGALAELIASQLATEGVLDEQTRIAANKLGVGIRQAEIVRDLRQDAHDGRIYLPLDVLEQHSVRPEELDKREVSANLRTVLQQVKHAAQEDLKTRLPSDEAHELLRPLRVLAALHHGLLERIAKRTYDVATARIDLGPIEKPWIAWREARRRR